MLFRSYIHHRFVIGSNGHTLSAVPKHPCIDNLQLEAAFEEQVIELLANPIYWNTYYWCEDTVTCPAIQMHKHPFDFELVPVFGNRPSYDALLTSMVNPSIEATNAFINRVIA